MPYRVDIHAPAASAFDELLTLGALDVEPTPQGLAALMPDSVHPSDVARKLGLQRLAVSPASRRDDGSTWVLAPRVVRAGRLLIAPAGIAGPAGALKLVDRPAFGSGLHPTTALSLEQLASILEAAGPERVLDVGTGSGVLGLAAVMLGSHMAVGVDIDPSAIAVARENARLNNLFGRFHPVLGGPDAISGRWPLVLANILAAPLIEIAPVLVRRLSTRGSLILSGVAISTAADVERAYGRMGLHLRTRAVRAGWTTLVFAASW